MVLQLPHLYKGMLKPGYALAFGGGIVLCALCLTAAAPKANHAPPGMQKLPPGENVLWIDPGDVASLDFTYGQGGKDTLPEPPFTFVKEDMTGSNPKVLVKDAKNRTWSVKWGKESHSDVFGSRIAWACGYVTEVEHYIGHGQILNVKGPLKRAGSEIQNGGYFDSARFQLRGDYPKFLVNTSWSWVNNPFRDTPQLNGLKIVMMLVSDWDNKDARDVDRDTNLGIFEEQSPMGLPRYMYLVADWGGSMGKWGNVATRDKWDAKGFASQTPDFVKGVHNGLVDFGYQGQRTRDQVDNIRVSDVQWVLKYLGAITDDQIRKGLAASGATPQEMDTFAAALRDRIEQLKRVAGRA